MTAALPRTRRDPAWTAKRPTCHGFFWVRASADVAGALVEVTTGAGGHLKVRDFFFREMPLGEFYRYAPGPVEWCGPVEPPGRRGPRTRVGVPWWLQPLADAAGLKIPQM